MTEVLIDTSAWIQFFRKKEDPVSSMVESLVESDRAVMTGVVMTELLQGTRSEKEARPVSDALIRPAFYRNRKDGLADRR